MTGDDTGSEGAGAENSGFGCMTGVGGGIDWKGFVFAGVALAPLLVPLVWGGLRDESTGLLRFPNRSFEELVSLMGAPNRLLAGAVGWVG